MYEPDAVNVWLGFCVTLVAPSPKSHCHRVGVPVELSVNCTACPAVGDEGLKLNAAVKAATRVSVRVAVCELVLLVTVSVTVLVPAVAYVWLGFWAVLVAPSPKFHCQEVGEPVDVSVNCTAWPVAGEAGLYVNEAARGVATVIVRTDEVELEPLETVRVTVLVPAVE